MTFLIFFLCALPFFLYSGYLGNNDVNTILPFFLYSGYFGNNDVNAILPFFFYFGYLGNNDTNTIQNKTKNGEDALGAIGSYYEYRLKYEEEMTEKTSIFTGAYLVQMIAYGLAAWERINDRDDMVDKLYDFMKYLHDTKHDVDGPQLDKIHSVLGMPGREFSYCDTAKRYLTQAKQDADGLTKMEEMYVNSSPMGAVEGWGLHDAQLSYPLANAKAAELMVTTGKRRVESYNAKRAELVHKGHVNVRGLFTSSSVLQYYQQAQAIYAGLADLYISGFNSAGAGLGVSLQRLANQSGSSPSGKIDMGQRQTIDSGFAQWGNPSGR